MNKKWILLAFVAVCIIGGCADKSEQIQAPQGEPSKPIKPGDNVYMPKSVKDQMQNNGTAPTPAPTK